MIEARPKPMLRTVIVLAIAAAIVAAIHPWDSGGKSDDSPGKAELIEQFETRFAESGVSGSFTECFADRADSLLTEADAGNFERAFGRGATLASKQTILDALANPAQRAAIQKIVVVSITCARDLAESGDLSVPEAISATLPGR